MKDSIKEAVDTTCKLFEIRDWANNLCFFGKQFNDFDDAYDYIYSTVPEDEYEEYSVIEVIEGGIL